MMMESNSAAMQQDQILEAFLHERPIGAQVYFERVVDKHMPIPAQTPPQVERVVDQRFVKAHRNTIALLGLVPAPRDPRKWIVTPTRRCGYCHQIYAECQNIGQWKCTFHPGMLAEDHAARWHHARHRWTCCNRIDNARGCTRCDHDENKQWTVDKLGAKVLVPVANFFLRQSLITAPMPESLIDRQELQYTQWTLLELRHSDDIRDTHQEDFFQREILANDGVLVARTDYYNAFPLVQLK